MLPAGLSHQHNEDDGDVTTGTSVLRMSADHRRSSAASDVTLRPDRAEDARAMQRLARVAYLDGWRRELVTCRH